MYAILLMVIAFSVVAAITLFKLIAEYSVKISAYAIDFALVFGLSTYYIHQFVPNKMVTGWMVYVLDIGVGILATLAYGILIVFIHNKLPKISSVLNLIISIIGMSIAFPLALDLISSILIVFGVVKESFTQITLFENQTGNTILNYGIILILAIPVYRRRMKYLNNSVKHCIVFYTGLWT